MAFGKINLAAVIFVPSHLFDMVHVTFLGEYDSVRMNIHPFLTGAQQPSHQAVHLHFSEGENGLRPQIPDFHDSRYMEPSGNQNTCNTGQRMSTGTHDHIRLSVLLRIAFADLQKSQEETHHVLHTGDSVAFIFTRLNKDKGNPFLFGSKIRLPVCVDTASGLMKLIGRKNCRLNIFFF